MSQPDTSELYERRRYRNPPVQEAVCEFRLVSVEEGQWDPTFPGRFYEHVRDEYPATPVQRGIAAPIELAQGNVPLPLGMAAKVQFADEAGEKLLSVGPDVLTVHALQPYQGWEDFRDRIERALHTFEQLAPSRMVGRIGLRYINRITLPTPAKLPEYFNAAPTTPDDFPGGLIAIQARWESLYDLDDPHLRLIYTFSSLPTEDEDSGLFLVDLDLIRSFPEAGATLADALERLMEMKRLENEAFEAVITDRTRELFDAG